MTITALISISVSTLTTAMMVTIGTEVKVLTDLGLEHQILSPIEITVMTVLDHLDQVRIVHVINLAALITNNAIPVIDKLVMTIIDNRVVETDLQIAITVETLA
jgi:hypothetical protein